jgi:hypothetical protein
MSLLCKTKRIKQTVFLFNGDAVFPRKEMVQIKFSGWYLSIKFADIFMFGIGNQHFTRIRMNITNTIGNIES